MLHQVGGRMFHWVPADTSTYWRDSDEAERKKARTASSDDASSELLKVGIRKVASSSMGQSLYLCRSPEGMFVRPHHRIATLSGVFQAEFKLDGGHNDDLEFYGSASVVCSSPRVCSYILQHQCEPAGGTGFLRFIVKAAAPRCVTQVRALLLLPRDSVVLSRSAEQLVDNVATDIRADQTFWLRDGLGAYWQDEEADHHPGLKAVPMLLANAHEFDVEVRYLVSYTGGTPIECKDLP